MLSEFDTIHALVCAYIEAKHTITEDDLPVGALVNIMQLDNFIDLEVSIKNSSW